jgi:hypothetical protein
MLRATFWDLPSLPGGVAQRMSTIISRTSYQVVVRIKARTLCEPTNLSRNSRFQIQSRSMLTGIYPIHRTFCSIRREGHLRIPCRKCLHWIRRLTIDSMDSAMLHAFLQMTWEIWSESGIPLVLGHVYSMPEIPYVSFPAPWSGLG